MQLMIAFIHTALWPVYFVADQLELRRLRRQFPFVYRRLINVPGGALWESDAEYLDRLRDVFDERCGFDGSDPDDFDGTVLGSVEG